MTIEERAKQLASIQGGLSDYAKGVIEKCCMQIATEQRQMDIDKGCEFLKQQGKDWWEGYGIPFSIEDYRKAMMEE